MFNSTVLDVVIGLVFIYLLYSLLATIIQEIIATHLKLRAKVLKEGISRMLDDDHVDNSLSEEFYNHPLIKFLGQNKSRSQPSYLTSGNFSKVLIDLLRGEKVQAGQSFSPLIQQALSDEKTQWGAGVKISPQTLSFLKSLWIDAQGDVEAFGKLVEQWFDDTMERASGWFKKKTQFILFVTGLSLAIIFNIDSISIAHKLAKNPKLATQLADNASIFAQSNQELMNQQGISDATVKDSLISILKKNRALVDSSTRLINENIADSNKLLGLGWTITSPNGESTFSFASNFHWWSIIGWLITALAVSLGAPFWFDLLNKLTQLRTSKRETPGAADKSGANTQPITVTLNNQTSEEAVG
jgi:hypothetical protein